MTVVKQIETLIAPAARADGGGLELEGRFDDLGFTSAHGNAVRLAVGASMLAALDVAPRVRCTAVAGEARPTVRLDSDDAGSYTVDAAVLEATADTGISILAGPDAISISFPR